MLSINVAVKSAAASKSNFSKVTNDTAMAGIPKSVPSMAAETVPE
jgi:hypothetical protein